MENKGQGALEYLLLIGGAVLVASVVIALITGIPPRLDPTTQAKCAQYISHGECIAHYSDPGCDPIDSDGDMCEYNGVTEVCDGTAYEQLKFKRCAAA